MRHILIPLTVDLASRLVNPPPSHLQKPRWTKLPLISYSTELLR